MFKKILYPTDFSEHAEKALKYVKKLKGAGTEEVVILHVVSEHGLDAVMEGCEWAGLSKKQCKDDILSGVTKEKKEHAEKLKALIEAAGLKAKIRIEFGKPATLILKISDDKDISLIIMGAHGKGKVEELLLGSITEKVLRHAKKPVLMVR